VIVGSTPLPRGELTKKLWDYIKKNKLQDEKKRTLINADDALKVVFGGKKQVSMFEMTKLVLWACKIGAVRTGDCRQDKSLRFNVHVHATFQ
jgi:chromatin remodeling complex protein RSC6